MYDKSKLKNVGTIVILMVPLILTETKISYNVSGQLVLRNYSFIQDDNFSIYNNRSLLPPQQDVTVRESGQDWGPRRDPLYIVIPVTIAYVAIFVTGLVGNIATCVVIASHRAMHTATNYYLFSLAVSDLLLLVSGLPTEIYYIWYKFPYMFGEAFCVLQGFAAETSANATVLTITAFTIERYVAICHPFLSHTMSKLSRAIRYIVAIWLLAMALAIPQAMSFGVLHELDADGRINKEHSVCTVVSLVVPHAFEISTVVFFVAPMSLITVLYILIGMRLRGAQVTRGGVGGSSVRLKHRGALNTGSTGNMFRSRGTPTGNIGTVVIVTPGGCESNIGSEKLALDASENEEDGRKNFPRNAQNHATKHVVKMLVAVVVAFFVCWAPFHAQRLLAVHGEMWRNSTPAVVAAFRILTYASGVLYYLSTTVNPLLYHIMSHKFREAFKDTFARFFRCDRRRCAGGGDRCYSTLSGRSSQPNSVGGGGTDSQCSRQSSLRHLEADVARLQLDTRRPLVVSFRRRRPNQMQEPPPAAMQLHSRSHEAEEIMATIVTEQLLRKKSPKRDNHHRKENNHFSLDLFKKNSTKCNKKHRCSHLDISPKHNLFNPNDDLLSRSPNGIKLSPNWKLKSDYYSDYYHYSSGDEYNRSQSTNLSPNWQINTTPNFENNSTSPYILKHLDTPQSIPVNYLFSEDKSQGITEAKENETADENEEIFLATEQGLQSKHICPRLQKNSPKESACYPNLEDIEVFEKEQFKIEKRKDPLQGYKVEKYIKTITDTSPPAMTKSCTLPYLDRCYYRDIEKDNFDEDKGIGRNRYGYTAMKNKDSEKIFTNSNSYTCLDFDNFQDES